MADVHAWRYGVISAHFPGKGYAWIDDGVGYVFMHANAMAATDFAQLSEGDRVEYVEHVPQPARGPRAHIARRID